MRENGIAFGSFVEMANTVNDDARSGLGWEQLVKAADSFSARASDPRGVTAKPTSIPGGIIVGDQCELSREYPPLTL